MSLLTPISGISCRPVSFQNSFCFAGFWVLGRAYRPKFLKPRRKSGLQWTIGWWRVSGWIGWIAWQSSQMIDVYTWTIPWNVTREGEWDGCCWHGGRSVILSPSTEQCRLPKNITLLNLCWAGITRRARRPYPPLPLPAISQNTGINHISHN